MRFALSIPPPLRADDTVAMARAAETLGVRSMWLYDAHRTWPDPYPHLALVASATRTLHFGVCVTNPVTRPPAVTGLLMATLQGMSGGRAELGIGRGDASVQALGERPATLDGLRAAITRFRGEVAGVAEGWRPDTPVPVWVGTYGPRGLRLAGAVADGVILQFAHPDLVSWAREFVREGAREAGRDPSTVRLMCAAPAAVGSRPDEARQRTRWFSRMIAADVAPLVRAHEDALPGLVSWARRYLDADGDGRLAVADEMSEAFALAGTVAECSERLAGLAALGVEEMNVFTLGGADALNPLEALIS